MKQKEGKDNRKIWFITLAIIIAGVTCLNIYLSSKISNDNKEEQLKATNQILIDKNRELKNRLDNLLPSAQEQQRREYLTTVEEFIKLSFHREKDGYVERKNKAKEIMNEEILKQFYPTENYQLPEEYKSVPSDMNFYLKEHNQDESTVNVLAEFKNTTTDSVKKTEEKTSVVLKVTVKKENDKWLVQSIEELNVKVI
ncbi:MerR family transcriptional regulator [Bacillus thuringiensis]|uniref:MerR family transcriptional regulator n=1 Tax=Bacillus thuringiensis TaxID=1428 RepID=UPI003CE6C078